MAKSNASGLLTSLDSLFTTQEQRDAAKRDVVLDLPLDQIGDFPNHPFKVRQDEAMMEMMESVQLHGVLVPCIVRDLTDDEAIIVMVDSNLQREKVLPSEKAFAYKMKLDAMKNQGTRSDLTSTQVVSKLRSNEKLGAENNQSRETVRRFIRLTNLIPELLDMVDNKTVSFNPAVELSYLSPEQQQEVIRAMDDTQNFPSVSQAKRIKKLAQDGTFTTETIVAIMGEEKKSELDTVTIKNDTLRKYFPRSYTPKQMEDTIIKLLEQWQKKRQHSEER